MSLQTPPTVQKLQTALRAKAKGEPAFRFYSLYDKVCRPDVLAHAYRRCKANRGAPGVDGQTFADIEAYGRRRWLGELARELKEKAYRPQAVRRVWIPKPNGKQRPLGIPTVRDRVVQMAVLLVVGPIFDVDLILRPRYAVNTRRRLPLQGIEAVLQQIDRHVVQQAGEPCASV